MRRAGVGLERRGVAPLLDEDERVGTELGLEAAEAFGVDGEPILDAAILGADGGKVGSCRFQYGFTLAGLGGDDGDDVDHEALPELSLLGYGFGSRFDTIAKYDRVT